MDIPEGDAPALHVSEKDAAGRLGQLLDRVQHGEKVVITRGGQAIAELSRVDEAPKVKKRLRGAMKGHIWVADDFDELGPEWDEYVK